MLQVLAIQDILTANLVINSKGGRWGGDEERKEVGGRTDVRLFCTGQFYVKASLAQSSE